MMIPESFLVNVTLEVASEPGGSSRPAPAAAARPRGGPGPWLSGGHPARAFNESVWARTAASFIALGLAQKAATVAAPLRQWLGWAGVTAGLWPGVQYLAA